MAQFRPNLALIAVLRFRSVALFTGLACVWAGAQELDEPENSAATPAAEIAAAPADPSGSAATAETDGDFDADAAALLAEIPTEAHLSWLEAQIEFLDLVKEGRLEEALPIAEEMVPLAAADFGDPSAEVATALSNLAIIQRNLELYDESKENYLAAIDMYRQVEGPFTASIIDPLVSLGANYHATGDYLQALGLFQEARTVNRRAYGLLNEDQVEIVYHISATLASMRRYEEAHLQQEDALRLMERVDGTDTLEILPHIYKYAEWLVSAFQFEAARTQYVRAMDIIRMRENENSILLVHPLTEIGNSYRTQKLAEGRGVSALKRALEIAESQENRDSLAVARVLRDIGDWYTAFSRVGATGEEYLQAWALLGDVEDGDALRREWFDEPEYVLREYPSTRGLTEANERGAVEGYVRVVFDVDESGKPQNAAVLESEPAGFKDNTMLRAIRRSRFRPRVVGGEFAYAPGLIRNFTFHYQPEE